MKYDYTTVLFNFVRSPGKTLQYIAAKNSSNSLGKSIVRGISIIRAGVWILRSRFFPMSEKDKEIAPRIIGNTKALWLGYNIPPKKQKAIYKPKEKKTLYLMHTSIKFSTSGYACRSHGLLSAINSSQWQIEGLTRLGFPFDMLNIGGNYTEEDLATSNVDGVTYSTLPDLGLGWGKGELIKYINLYAQTVYEYCLEKKPAIIHGASNFLNGLVAAKVGNKLGIPSIYEVRGLWEVTRMSRTPGFKYSPDFMLYREMEVQACNSVDHVYAITTPLAEELKRSGVKKAIEILPNGVNPAQFQKSERNSELAVQLKIDQNTQVIGYVGSLVQYEGLDLLLYAIKLLSSQRNDFHLLIVGDGRQLEPLQTLTRELNLEPLVTFTGRVSHKDVTKYYSLIDIAPFPRLPLPVCEMVSPLKPFEAMAMEKAVVASNVTALKEIVKDSVNGRLFEKGNASELSKVIDELLSNKTSRQTIARNSREWVLENRSWQTISQNVIKKYDQLYKEFQSQQDS